MTLTYLGPTVGAGGLIVPAAGDALDPLLAEAVLLLRASAWDDPADIANEGTLGAAGDPTNAVGLIMPDLWTGTALVGYMTLDGGYDVGDPWFTDLDFRWTAAVAPHTANNPAAKWSEVMVISVTGSGSNRDYIEPAFLFEDNGDICIGVDWDSVGTDDPGSWISDPVGTWDVGIAEADWRVTVVAATGAVTLYKDGVSIQTDNVGATSFPEPADKSVVQSGPFQYATAVKSWSLRASIGGAEILGFDASDTTGWTFEAWAALTGTAPSEPFLYVGGSSPVTVADNAAFNIAADGAITVAALWRMGDTTNRGEFVTHFTSSSIPGWAVVPGSFLGPDGTTLAAAVSAGGAPSVIVVGTPTPGERQLVVTVVDLDGDLSGFLDGVEATPADISSLGAINATDALKATGFVEAWAIWDRALTGTEITVDLPAALGI